MDYLHVVSKIMPCIRTGMCCQRIPIGASPATLRKWATYDEQANLIYDMIGDRCLGKIKHGIGETLYVYGPCRWYKKDPLPTCGAQKFKPKMCSGYPYYDHGENEKVVTFKGCGFGGGWTTIEDMDSKLEPLTNEEL